jgi:hypothetical protein
MARDIGDGIEARIITKLGLADMEHPTKVFVVQLNRDDDDVPHIGIGVDTSAPGDEDSLVGIMTLPEACLIYQALGFAIHEILGLYAEAQSDNLAMKTMGLAGGPTQVVPDIEIQFPDLDDQDYRGDERGRDG